MEDDISSSFFPKNLFKNPFGDVFNSDWDTVKSNSYVSPDGSVQIHTSVKTWSSDDSRPNILTGPEKPLSNFQKVENTMENAFKSMDEEFKSMNERFKNIFGKTDDIFGKKDDDFFGSDGFRSDTDFLETRKINPRIIADPQIAETETQNIDSQIFYLLCTMGVMLLLLSAILTGMTYHYRKRSQKQRNRDFVVQDDAPPTYNSATQAIVKMTTPEGEPLKGVEAPPPYKN